MLVDEQVGHTKLMSNGPFQIAFYETDAGNTVPIRVQPETLGLTIDGVANDPVAGPVSAGFPSAQTSQSRRALGINARRVRCVYDTGASAGLPGLSITLPWLNPATFAALGVGATGTYEAEPIQLRSTLGEEIR